MAFKRHAIIIHIDYPCHMKLLLSSGGITNKSIAKALFELVGKKPEETSLLFIPTAANVEIGDKGWLIDDLLNLKKQNFRSIDIADISAIGKELLATKLAAADVLFFEGGNSYHLMEWLDRSGLSARLPALLEDKVYVGVSAGSMVTGKDLNLKVSQALYEEDLERTEDMAGLKLVDFYVLPHLNSPYFPNVREAFIKEVIYGITETVYAIDDDSALKVIDGQAEIISEGKWLSNKKQP